MLLYYKVLSLILTHLGRFVSNIYCGDLMVLFVDGKIIENEIRQIFSNLMTGKCSFLQFLEANYLCEL